MHPAAKLCMLGKGCTLNFEHCCVCYHLQELDSHWWKTPKVCRFPLTSPRQPPVRNPTPMYVTTDKTWTAPCEKPHPCVCYHWQDLDSPLWETPPLCMLPLTRPGQPPVRNPTPVYVTTDKTWTAPCEKPHPCVCNGLKDQDNPWLETTHVPTRLHLRHQAQVRMEFW